VRVPAPGLLKLDRALLLRDVRERLAESIPHYKNGDDDPTDPGWLLLEQSAWLVEMLSEQLDKYPYQVVQQFVHMMGGHLRPAQPAVGVVVVDVGAEGLMSFDKRRPAPWRFYTPQTEDLDSIEFVPTETDVHLRKGTFASMCELAADEVFLVGPTDEDDLVGQVLLRDTRRRSTVFAREEVWFEAVSNNKDTLKKGLENAMKELEDRRVGWLDLRLEDVSRDRLRLVARIKPEGAFARVATGGIWEGGDLEGDWGTLDGSTWTPVVSIRRHPMLPPHLHDQFPLPGYEEGQILLTDIPENFPVAELLERKASPMPDAVIHAIWQTLSNLDGRVDQVKPVIRTVFPSAEELGPMEPTWVGGALESGIWPTIAQNQPKTLFHLQLTVPSKKASSARVAVVHELPAGSRIPRVTAYGINADGHVERDPLKTRERWRMPAPPREGSTIMPTVVAYDVDIPANGAGLLLVCAGKPQGAMLNAMMVGNMPAVADGRQALIDRNVPIEFSLLYEDVVNTGVVDQLLEEPIPNNAASVIRKLPLSWFGVEDESAVEDFEGVQLDASEGALIFNAPDAMGHYRQFRPGTRVRVDWYRRTNGAAGNRPPGTIRLVEQPPRLSPKITSVTNPLGMYFGADREAPEAAIERMFGPTGGTPVLASDFERQVRQALGTRGRGWFVRCWTYAERALVTSCLWPFGDNTESEHAELERQLADAGPDTLLVVVGMEDEILADDDLDWARRAVERLMERLRRRLPTVRHAVVTRFWPLELEVEPDSPEVPVPCFEIEAMRGTLTDTRGRTADEVPTAVVLLNAGVVKVIEREQELL
jgi:hypothetical protein